MDNFEWDPEVKKAFDAFDWQNVDVQHERNISSQGILSQIGCDYASLLMDILSPSSGKGGSHNHKHRKPSSDCLPQPCSSRISHQLQTFYLKFLDKFGCITDIPDVPKKERKFFLKFKEIRSKLMVERQEFATYAFQNALHRIKDYDYVHKSAEEYFQKHLTCDIVRLKRYLSKFVHYQQVTVDLFPYTTDPRLSYENISVSLGTCPKVKMPREDAEIPGFNRQENITRLPVVSCDVNAEKLAASCQADIVLSFSSLRILANNFAPFLEEWEMPMLVRKVEDAKGGTRYVIFIDKALPAKSVNGRDKTYKYMKRAVKHLVLHGGKCEIKHQDTTKRTRPTVETPNQAYEETNKVSPELPQDSTTRNPESSASECSMSGVDDEYPAHKQPLPSTEGTIGNVDQQDLSMESSGDDLPQLDGVNDVKPKRRTARKSLKASAVTTKPEQKRGTGISSSPPKQRQHTVADITLWQKSFDNLPKSTLAASSSTTPWFRKEVVDSLTTGQTNKIENSDGDDDDLVMDIDEENDDQEVESNCENPAPLEEGQELSYKPSDLVLKMAQTVCQDMNSSDDASCKNDNAVATPLRRSTRQRSKAASRVSDKEETPKRERKSSKSLYEMSLKRKNVRSTSDGSDVNPQPEDEGTRCKASKSSKKIKSSSNSAKSHSALGDSSCSDNNTAIENKTKKKLIVNFQHKARSKQTKQQVTSSKTSSSKGKEIGDEIKAKITLPDTMEADTKADSLGNRSQGNRGLTKTSSSNLLAKTTVIARVNVASSRTPTPKSSNLANNEATKQVRKPTNATKRKEIATKVTAKNEASERMEASTNQRTREDSSESGDLLGRILGMQQDRKERLSQEGFMKADKPGPVRPVVPAIPEDSGDSFDSIMQQHKLIENENGEGAFYTLWSISNIRILLRGCLHGKMSGPVSKGKERSEFQTRNVSVHTKLEYQTDLGHEVLTRAEACAEWVNLKFRPQPSEVLRFRVNPMTQKIICVDHVKNEQSTYNDYDVAGFSGLRANKLLLTVFKHITTPNCYLPGQYLICHKNEVKSIFTRKACVVPSNKMVIYDLQHEYSKPGRTVYCTPQAVPWVTLDPKRQLPWQEANGRIPMTFDPKSGNDSNEPPRTQKKKKSKKSKRKKEASQHSTEAI